MYPFLLQENVCVYDREVPVMLWGARGTLPRVSPVQPLITELLDPVTSLAVTKGLTWKGSGSSTHLPALRRCYFISQLLIIVDT